MEYSHWQQCTDQHCNVAVGSYNLQNLTMGQHNTAIGQGLMDNLKTGSGNFTLGYQASGGYGSTNGFQMGSNNKNKNKQTLAYLEL